MDNYNLSNLPHLGDSADSAESHLGLTAEQNRQATFSGRSATSGIFDQTELQLLLTYEEQLSVQRVIADFDISLLPSTRDRATSDEPEDPFAALAAYQPPTFDDSSQHPSASEPGPGSGFLEGFTAEALTDVQAEPEGHDFLEQPEQSQKESDTQGIIIPESTIPVTVSDKRSGKRRAPDPKDMVTVDSPESVINKSSRRSDRLTGKRRKLASTDTEFLPLPLPRGKATESQAVGVPKKSATFRKKFRRQDPDESLRARVKEETDKWIVECKDSEKRFMCSYPDCGYTSPRRGNLQVHIFKHTRISLFKCHYPECSEAPYFRSSFELLRHGRSNHTYEQPYHCVLCNLRFTRLDNYKKHMSRTHII